MSDAPRNWADEIARRQPMRASSNMAPKPMSLPNLPRRMIVIGVGLTGSVLLASGIIWGISRMGPSTPPVIESDGRPFRVRPDTAPPVAASTATAPTRPGETRVAQAPEAPRLDSLRQQMTAPPEPVAPAAREAAPEQPAAPAPAAAPAARPGQRHATAPAPTAPAAARQAQPAAATPARPAAATPARPAATPERPAHVLTPPGSAPAAAPAAARATPAPAGRGNIQLAAVASEAAARTEWDRIKRRVPELASHSPSFLKVEREGRAPIWRLRVQGVGDARALCGRLRERGVACDPV